MPLPVYHLCHPSALMLRSSATVNLWDAATPEGLCFRTRFIGLSPHLASLSSFSLPSSLCVSSSVLALGHQLLHGGLSLIPPHNKPWRLWQHSSRRDLVLAMSWYTAQCDWEIFGACRSFLPVSPCKQPVQRWNQPQFNLTVNNTDKG